MMDRTLRWLDLAIFLACFLYVLVTGPHASNWWAGMAVASLSMPFWIAARMSLGASFSIRPESRKLVTRGLYSKFRHPVYTFGTPAVLGVLVAYLGFGALAIGFIIVPVEILRARREEARLLAGFGDEYEAYRATPWF